MLDTTAAATINQVLADLDRALAANDPEAAAALFEPDGYWRDLVELHLEHPHDGRARRDRRDAARPAPAHRAARLDDHPRRGRRGRRRLPAGLDRLRDRNRPRARPHPRPRRQDLDAPDHADGAQGPRGASRRRPGRRGVDHGAIEARRSWAERRVDEAGEPRSRGAARGGHHRRRPGRHRARRAAAPARRADDHRRAQRPARRQLAQAVQVALPARPGLVRPPALHPVPRELAGLLAQGQDRRLARDVHPRDGAELLDLDHRRAGELGRHREGMARSASAATARRSSCARSSSCSPPACRASRTSRPSRARTSSRASSTIPRGTRGRTPTRARRSSSSARTTRRTTSPPRSGRRAPT